MPDFDLEKSTREGLSFRNIFIDIIVFAISVFLGFSWKDLFTEIIQAYMPEGHNLIEKTFIMFLITIIMAWIAWRLIKKKKVKKTGNNNKAMPNYSDQPNA
jgi:hypothetical protein